MNISEKLEISVIDDNGNKILLDTFEGYNPITNTSEQIITIPANTTSQVISLPATAISFIYMSASGALTVELDQTNTATPPVTAPIATAIPVVSVLLLNGQAITGIKVTNPSTTVNVQLKVIIGV